jgi:pimeloyl-ACP methyl ester carboxylesterase
VKFALGLALLQLSFGPRAFAQTVHFVSGGAASLHGGFAAANHPDTIYPVTSLEVSMPPPPLTTMTAAPAPHPLTAVAPLAPALRAIQPLIEPAAEPGAAAGREASSAGEDASEAAQKRWDDAGPTKAVVVLVHGLNVDPGRMSDLAGALESGGAKVLRVSLSGHAGKGWGMVTRRQWLDDIAQAHGAAVELARGKNAPIHLVAHSLGGLIGLDWIGQREGERRWDRMVLLAPAISLTRKARLLRLLSWLPRSFMIPSLLPKRYRANEGTSVGAYKVLSESIAALERREFKDANIPTLVVIDPKDELVSVSGIAALIERFHLGSWSLMPIDNAASTLQRKAHHLTFTAEALGAAEWRRLVKAMNEHLAL